MGAAAEAKARVTEMPIVLEGVLITSGDLMCLDQVEGVVSIPERSVGDVVAWLERRGTSEDAVMAAVKAGSSVEAAFAAYRK